MRPPSDSSATGGTWGADGMGRGGTSGTGAAFVTGTSGRSRDRGHREWLVLVGSAVARRRSGSAGRAPCGARRPSSCARRGSRSWAAPAVVRRARHPRRPAGGASARPVGRVGRSTVPRAGAGEDGRRVRLQERARGPGRVDVPRGDDGQVVGHRRDDGVGGRRPGAAGSDGGWWGDRGPRAQGRFHGCGDGGRCRIDGSVVGRRRCGRRSEGRRLERGLAADVVSWRARLRPPATDPSRRIRSHRRNRSHPRPAVGCLGRPDRAPKVGMTPGGGASTAEAGDVAALRSGRRQSATRGRSAESQRRRRLGALGLVEDAQHAPARGAPGARGRSRPCCSSRGRRARSRRPGSRRPRQDRRRRCGCAAASARRRSGAPCACRPAVSTSMTSSMSPPSAASLAAIVRSSSSSRPMSRCMPGPPMCVHPSGARSTTTDGSLTSTTCSPLMSRSRSRAGWCPRRRRSRRPAPAPRRR